MLMLLLLLLVSVGHFIDGIETVMTAKTAKTIGRTRWSNTRTSCVAVLVTHVFACHFAAELINLIQ
jgi:hypothetical protein